ncbi:MAG: leucyl aminopeptidase [Deltaproteobacteria bacterium]|nr:MAG: leucyl aminopeptidase [Deltaproteobacteria bacterium]
MDDSLKGFLTTLLKREDFKAHPGDARLIDIPEVLGAKAIVVMGIGEAKKIDREVLRKFAAAALKQANKVKAKKISYEDLSFLDPSLNSLARGQVIAEGVTLAQYTFDDYRSEKQAPKKTVSHVEVITDDLTGIKNMQLGFSRGQIFAESTNFARSLINIPAVDMTPKRLADEAKKIAKQPGISIKVLEKKEIERLGMGLYLAVAKGSEQPPYFVHLTYKPSGKAKKKIVIIGKAVTFDSGGLSLKPPNSMETMKDDMSGSAAMLGVMKALSALKPSVEVHGICAATENMPSGAAERPGDIARAMNGKTVEILNTDAEGRLTLADAICYAQKLKPDLMINAATLTGACVVALGDLCSGIMGNNQDLIQDLIHCGKEAGEKLWQMPLIEEYKEELKSPIADLKNVGGRWGGTINGGLFLQEFVDSSIPWAHVDIAGPSWTEKELAYCPRGGTGHLTRTLLHFLLKQ